MGSDSIFQRGFLGYRKKDVDEKFDSIKKDFLAEKEKLEQEKEQLVEEIAELTQKQNELKVIQEQIEQSYSELEQKNELLSETNSRLSERDECYEEVAKSVTSIMSLTQRTSEKMYEDAIEKKNLVASIAFETAGKVVGIRQEVVDIRKSLDKQYNELQMRLDSVDAIITSAVSNLVTIKNEILDASIGTPGNVQEEIDQLLQYAQNSIGVDPSSRYRIPEIGRYSTTLITDSAAKVMDSRNATYNNVTGNTAQLRNKSLDSFFANTKLEGIQKENPSDSVVPNDFSGDPEWFTSSPLINMLGNSENEIIMDEEVSPIEEPAESFRQKIDNLVCESDSGSERNYYEPEKIYTARDFNIETENIYSLNTKRHSSDDKGASDRLKPVSDRMSQSVTHRKHSAKKVKVKIRRKR